jgi:DNA-binding GntR family transcriptional regulator
MGLVLGSFEMRARVWVEHRAIVDAVLAGDVRSAGHLARGHTARAGEETARRIDTVASVA